MSTTEFRNTRDPQSPARSAAEERNRQSRLDRAFRLTGLEGIARGTVLRTLARVENADLRVELPDGRVVACGDTTAELRARLRVRDERFFRRVVLGGDLGFADAYIDGDWDTDDLSSLILLLANNRDNLSQLTMTTDRLQRWVTRVGHLRRRNSRPGSRRNVRDHYDLGNGMFATCLDPSMTYSCAMFDTPEDTLQEAQQRKLDRILDLADIGPADHVLEIGCGWGSFAERAVERTGCRVTGLTLSKEQKTWAERRFHDAGMAERVDVQLRDYRDVEGTYDKIVSIEMLEAVGEENLPTFFRRCERALRPSGRLVVQVITIADELYPAYRRGTDFIQKHIFPGGHLPSRQRLAETIRAHTSMSWLRDDNIGAHYAPTLARWRDRFRAGHEELAMLGFDQAHVRKWMYYFSYCEAGFRAGALGNLQLVLAPGEMAGS